jgi:hypothetical protein
MNKFKVGDDVIISEVTNSYSGKLTLGSLAVVGEFNHNCTFARMIGELNIMCGWHDLNNIKHAEKWSIYSNTLPWSELSDKQKGKLLLGRHQGLDFTIDGLGFKSVSFDCVFYVYKAIKPEPEKPEPTMAELLTKDILGCSGFLRPHDVDELIAKGWTKPCK